MAMTEPQAGSSLGDIATSATPARRALHDAGAENIHSAGDHDCADNIVHLLLARIVGAPPGLKGISLFLVPKKRFDAGETLS